MYSSLDKESDLQRQIAMKSLLQHSEEIFPHILLSGSDSMNETAESSNKGNISNVIKALEKLTEIETSKVLFILFINSETKETKEK